MIEVSQKQIRTLLFLYTAIIVQATMWPYNFTFGADFTALRLRAIQWIPFAHQGTGVSNAKDIILNVILFLPFGGLLFLYRAKGNLECRSPWIPALYGMLLSGFVETLQIWLPSRFTSATDLCTNTLGAFLGAAAADAYGNIVRRSGADEVRRAFRDNALFLALAGYVVVLFLSNVYTLDPVGSVPELAARAKGFLRSPLLDDLHAAKVVGPILYFGVLTFLAAEWAMVSFPWARNHTTYLVVFFFCSVFAVGLEILQIFFRSRFPLRSDALLGVFGCAYGILLHRITGFPVFRALGDRFNDPFSALKHRLRMLSSLFLFHYPLLILYAFLYPFDFSVSHFHLDIRALIPFYYHITHPDYASVYVILRPVVAWLPAGIALAGLRGNLNHTTSPARTALFAAAGQLFVEAGRAFTSDRHPDVTNVLMAFLGAYSGVRIWQNILDKRKKCGPYPGRGRPM